jgi:hypothetical protein
MNEAKARVIGKENSESGMRYPAARPLRGGESGNSSAKRLRRNSLRSQDPGSGRSEGRYAGPQICPFLEFDGISMSESGLEEGSSRISGVRSAADAPQASSVMAQTSVAVSRILIGASRKDSHSFDTLKTV